MCGDGSRRPKSYVDNPVHKQYKGAMHLRPYRGSSTSTRGGDLFPYLLFFRSKKVILSGRFFLALVASTLPALDNLALAKFALGYDRY